MLLGVAADDIFRAAQGGFTVNDGFEMGRAQNIMHCANAVNPFGVTVGGHMSHAGGVRENKSGHGCWVAENFM